MEKYAWKARIRPGCKDEYARRHAQIWPEMAQLLRQAGVRNYSIWTDGELLFGYYECAFGVDTAAKAQTVSPVTARWDAYMSDVLIMEPDPVTGVQPKLEQVFELDR